MICQTADDAVKQPTLAQLARHTDKVQLFTQIVVMVEKTMDDSFAPARRLSSTSIASWARKLLDRWQHETLADVRVFLQGVAVGEFDGGEYYSNVDEARWGKWWSKYLEGKADALERVQHLTKKSVMDEETPEEAKAREEREATYVPAEKWRELARSLRMERPRQVDNRSKRDDELRRKLPLMTVDQLRDAYRENQDAWSRRLILCEAQERGLLDASLNKAAGEVDAKAEADRIVASGLTAPLPELPSDRT